MPSQADARSYGTVFDEVADDYDRHRPSYPDTLVDEACEAAGIGPGSRVLEIGCGAGQLTRSLLARDLRVTAVEPGGQLLGAPAISWAARAMSVSSTRASKTPCCRLLGTTLCSRRRRSIGSTRM